MSADDLFSSWSFGSSTPRPNAFHLEAETTYGFQAMDLTLEQNVIQQAESRVPHYTSHSTIAASVQRPGDDTAMLDPEIPGPSDPGPPSSGPRGRKRTKYGHLDWHIHKNEIRKLYLDEDRTLKETMEIMVKTRSFNASEKLYKKKFKEWDWQKNLPVEIAVFMTQKARERKQEENKDTVFLYGGRQFDYKRAEDTISRAKRSRTSQMPVDAETPQGVSYETPVALIMSPSSDAISEEEGDWDTSSECTDIDEVPQLSWQRSTGSDFLNMWKSAIAISKQNKAFEAEGLLEQALDGLCHVSGITHEDTRKVSYDLANLYIETGRDSDAIRVVERVIRDHVKVLGFRNRTTQQVVLQVVEHLNAWNKHTEALGLLARAKEIHTRLSSDIEVNEYNLKRRASRKGKGIIGRGRKANSDCLFDINQDINERPDPHNVENDLRIARNYVACKSENAERLLLATIEQCELHPENLAKQNIIARGELIKLYQKLGSVRAHTNELSEAMKTYKKLWSSYTWDEGRFECFEFIEAVLQLAANLLKSENIDEAKYMFREASEKATTIFRNSDKRTVWVYITIGIVYL